MECMYYGATDTGRYRAKNEDTYLLEQISDGQHVIAVVADGIGGYEGGEIASYLACKFISEYLKDISAEEVGLDVLKQSLIYANNAICSQHVNPILCRMGCVLTAVLFDLAHDIAHMCHVGDTRLYQYGDGKLTKLSHDHSPVGAQEEAGLLSEEEAMAHPQRNMITRYVGKSQLSWYTEYIMTESFPIEAGTQYLICSDGIYDMITSSQISEILAKDMTVQQKVETMIQDANNAGGKDNITAIIIETKNK